MVRTRATSFATTTVTDLLVDASNQDDPPPQPEQNTGHTQNPPSRLNRSSLNDCPPYEDVRRPYYLSIADHPGLALATPVLIDRNF
uniref:Uncharacterized protein n=1 Tax=Cannabis sativa TaxID=3483 RepID=A0A803NUC8_CANSA